MRAVVAGVCAPSGGTANNWTGTANKVSAPLCPLAERTTTRLTLKAAAPPAGEQGVKNATGNCFNTRNPPASSAYSELQSRRAKRRSIPSLPETLWMVLPKLGSDGSTRCSPRTGSGAWKHDGCSPSPPKQTGNRLRGLRRRI